MDFCGFLARIFRLVTLPMWDIAVQTERRARLNVASYAGVVSDKLLRGAIELNAFEEGRHKHVLSDLVVAYGIVLAPEPAYVVQGDPEWAFMVTGTRHSGGSPAYSVLRQLGRMAPPDNAALAQTALRAQNVGVLGISYLGAYRSCSGRERRRSGQQPYGDWANSLGDDIDLAALADLRLIENRRRMNLYDSRLLKPFFVLAIARLARRFMRSRNRTAT